VDQLNIDELLRYVFAGAVLLVAIGCVFPDALDCPGLPQIIKDNIETVGGVTVLVAGSLIYVLHRALAHRAFYWIGVKMVWGWNSPTIIELDLQRFKRRANDTSSQKYLDKWASQAHYLFCVFWAVFIASTIGMALNKSIPVWLYFSAGVALVSAFLHQYRLHRREQAVARSEQT